MSLRELTEFRHVWRLIVRPATKIQISRRSKIVSNNNSSESHQAIEVPLASPKYGVSLSAKAKYNEIPTVSYKPTLLIGLPHWPVIYPGSFVVGTLFYLSLFYDIGRYTARMAVRCKKCHGRTVIVMTSRNLQAPE